MNTKEKQTNYDEKTIEKMTSIYTAAGTEPGEEGDKARQNAVEEIQRQTGKSLHSIRAKLGQLKIYIPKGKPVTKGAKRETKADMIAVVASNAPDKHAGFFDSLEGANKTVISYVIALQNEHNENLTEEISVEDS